jgi:hypothetical protein
MMAFTTSDESFTYSQMLHESNHKQYFEAMEIELDDHASQKHWILMLRKDLPIGSKTIMAIWSFKQKHSPTAVSTNTNLVSMHMEGRKLGAKTIVIHMLQL